MGLQHVLWIGGPPGSGKTALATRLARRYGLAAGTRATRERWPRTATGRSPVRGAPRRAGREVAGLRVVPARLEQHDERQAGRLVERPEPPVVGRPEVVVVGGGAAVAVDDARERGSRAGGGAPPELSLHGSGARWSSTTSARCPPRRSSWPRGPRSRQARRRPEPRRLAAAHRGLPARDARERGTPPGPLSLYLLLGETIASEAREADVPVLEVNGSLGLDSLVAAVESGPRRGRASRPRSRGRFPASAARLR